jgi:hypothetical protein
MIANLSKLMGFALFLSLVAATQPPASKPALGEQRSLANDLIQYNEPLEPWATPAHDSTRDSIVYTTSDRLGQLAILVEPKDMSTSENVAAAIVKELRAKRQKAGTKVIMPAKVEKDSRFAIRIHEKYVVGGKTSDSVQLFRNVGPRVVLVIVASVADDGDAVAAMHKTGEEVLLSAKFNRKAMK